LFDHFRMGCGEDRSISHRPMNGIPVVNWRPINERHEMRNYH